MIVLIPICFAESYAFDRVGHRSLLQGLQESIGGGDKTGLFFK